MIDDLLKQIREDKSDNLSTTSFKFKTDLWNFFSDHHDKVAVEFGTHKGQTTRILSFLFKTVYTININDNQSSKEFNFDRNNIIYIDNFDLYSNQQLIINDTIDMFLIDAGHEYGHVITDINTAFSLNCSAECYMVFDDYGLEQYRHHVHRAVNEAMTQDILTLIRGIGHTAGYNFGGTPPRILTNDEGVITKINWK